eukprot:jgi/Mesvir1/17397/Mv25039-RA.6
MAPGASFTGSSASAYAGLLMLIALTASTTVLGHALDEDVAMDGAMQVDTGAATRSLLAAALPPAGARPVPTLSSVGGSYLNGVYFVPASDTQPRVLATFTEDVTPVSTVASTRYNGWLLITSNYRDNFVAATSRTFLFEVIGVPVDTQISVCMTAGKVKNAAGRTSDKSNCIDIVRASPPASPAPKDCPQSRAQEATGKVTPVGFSPPDAASKAFGPLKMACDKAGPFIVGKQTVKCQAVDPVGQGAACAPFDIEVKDTTPPHIKCPTEPVKKGAAADHFANGKKTFVDWDASADDVVDGEIELKCEGGNSGEGFGVGKHNIKCTAEDGAKNKVECDFDVEVEDETPPDIKCPTEPVKKGAAADHFKKNKTTLVDWEASAEDNVDGEIELKCEGGNSGEGFGVGKHSIKCTAEDEAKHVVECDFDVEVEDETPPDIKCPTEPVKKGAAADHFANGKKTFVDWEASAEDNVDGEIELKCEGGNSGEGFGVGKHSIKCTAEDEANHVVECDFDVEVEDETPPDIKCPTEPVKKGAAADHFANGKKTFVDWEASAEDNVDGEIELKCEGGNSGEGFGVGKHSIKCTAEDEANHVVECDFDVEVEDETPPDITCPEMPIEEEASDQHGSDKHWTAATWEEASAEDNVDGKLPVVCDHKPGDKFDVDSTIVKCSVKDSAGKATECSFEVNIKDNKKPDLTCPKRIETALGVATVWGDNAAPTALDNVDGPLTGIKCVDEDKLPVDLPQEFTLGNHHITCSAADSHGNEGTCQILLVVSDKTAPNIHCPASVVQEASDDHKSNGHKTKAVLDTSADDSVDGTVSVDCGGNNEFDVGNTIVECSASDKSGNKATCQIKVTIQDKKKPTVSCPGNIEVTQGVGISLAATASDNVDDSLNVQCTDKDGKIVTSTSSLPLGTNGITCTATDSSGNEGRCSFNVKVAQATPVPATPVPATPVPATPVPATPEPETACRTDADCPAGKRCQGAVDKKKCVGSGSAAIAEATGGEASFSTATATDFRAAKSGVSIGLIVGVVAAVALLAAAVIGVIITRKRTHPKRLTVSTHQAAEEPNPAVTVSVRSGGTPRSRRGTPRSGAVMHPVARLGELRQERVRRFRPSDDGTDTMFMDIPQNED